MDNVQNFDSYFNIHRHKPTDFYFYFVCEPGTINIPLRNEK
jgi:hypothetical protein